MAEKFYPPKKEFSLDPRDFEGFVYDMSRCIKCKGCYWVEHTYMPGVRFSTRCPSGTWNDFDAYQAAGKMRIAHGLAEGKIEWSPKLLEIVYADPLCGACDVGCKRNLDLEIELTLEALRVKAVRDGVGPMPEHKKLAENIAKTHNHFGAPHEKRNQWITDAKPVEKADIMYFPGCSASYVSTEIARATAKILKETGTTFMTMADEWCCGNVIYSVGMYDEAKGLAQRNVEAVRASGAKVLLTSCAECYRQWKVDYPKMLEISTSDLGFEVMHLVQFADEQLKKGALKLTKRLDLRVAYHDSCGISRLADPWTPYKGTRGWMGMVEPRLKRRRGTYGLYSQPRTILKAIPGVQFEEMPRTRENSMCCGAGRGTKAAFPDLAEFAARNRMEEVCYVGAEALVSTCPWCKTNFTQAVRRNGNNVKVMDIAEVIAASME